MSFNFTDGFSLNQLSGFQSPRIANEMYRKERAIPGKVIAPLRESADAECKA
jgi:hypothetical protein